MTKSLFTFCKCGGRYLFKNYLNHLRTKRHILYDLYKSIEEVEFEITF